MRRLGTIRVAAGLALVFILFGVTLSQARAGGTADLVIHSRLCPTGYAGDNLFADCHDIPGPPHFSINGPETTGGSADAAGNVIFADLIPGSYNVYEPVKFLDNIVYCSLDGAEGTIVVPPSTGGEWAGRRIDIPAGFQGSVICDWYFIASCYEGIEVPCWTPPAASDPSSSGAVTGLPNTGAGTASDPNSYMILYGLGVFALGMTAIAGRRRATR